MSAANWIRVASGFRQVVVAATSLVAKEGASGASALTKHGVDLAQNARTAVKAAGTMVPSNIKTVEIDGKLDQLSTTQTKTNSDESDVKPVLNVQQKGDELKSFGKEVTKEQPREIPLIETTPDLLQEGQAVPSTRIGRAAGFASLGIGLVAGTVVEAASRIVSMGSNSSSPIVANDANADRLAKTLCRMRGAALKLGQMLSIQDETLLPAPMAKALEQVRQGADAMPLQQLHGQLVKEFGENWRDKFVQFEVSIVLNKKRF